MSVRSTNAPAISVWLWLVASLLATFSASVVLVAWLQPTSDRFTLLFGDVATASAATSAALGLTLGALRSHKHVRLGLLLVAAGLACWTVGEWGWSWYDYDTGEAPFPSWLDGFYLAGYPFIVAGAVVLASPGRALAQARTMPDGLALVAAVTAVMWHLVLAPTYKASDTSVLERAVGGAYPVVNSPAGMSTGLFVLRAAFDLSQTQTLSDRPQNRRAASNPMVAGRRGAPSRT